MAEKARDAHEVPRFVSVSTRWLDRYMEIPYRDGGRDFGGCDCFGLYALILANEAKAPGLQAIAERTLAAKITRIEAEMMAGRWAQIIGTPLRFDCVLMKTYARVARGLKAVDLHIGCALGDGRFVHTEEGVGPHIDAFSNPPLTIRGIYRPTCLAEAA